LAQGQVAQAREHIMDDRGHLRLACKAQGRHWALVRPDAYLVATGESIAAGLVQSLAQALALS